MLNISVEELLNPRSKDINVSEEISNTAYQILQPTFQGILNAGDISVKIDVLNIQTTTVNNGFNMTVNCSVSAYYSNNPTNTHLENLSLVLTSADVILSPYIVVRGFLLKLSKKLLTKAARLNMKTSLKNEYAPIHMYKWFIQYLGLGEIIPYMKNNLPSDVLWLKLDPKVVYDILSDSFNSESKALVYDDTEYEVYHSVGSECFNLWNMTDDIDAFIFVSKVEGTFIFDDKRQHIMERAKLYQSTFA